VEEAGYNPQEHGWAKRMRTTLSTFGGDEKTDENKNVYHSLQLTQGNYKLSFIGEGDADKTVSVKIRKMPSSTLIYEGSVNSNEKAELNFTTNSKWGEYKILFTCRNKADNITIKNIRIDAVNDADGIVSITNSQQPTSNGIYDLQGRRLSFTTKLKSGIYIINGKKTIIQ
jgi:hypothetical protein